MSIFEEQCKNLKGPYQIGLDITNKCNYRCLHCYNSSGENNSCNNELTDDEVLKLIKDIADIKPCNICFCGGEPLLRLDLLLQCCDVLHNNGVKNISMVSNGYFMTDAVAEKLKKHHLNHIQISLDGATKETCYELRQHEQAFDKAINAIKIIANSGSFGLNAAFCPTKNNITQFEEVCNICCSLGVSQLRVQPLMIIGRANENLARIMPSNEQYIELVKKIKQVKQKYLLKNFDIEYGDPLDHIFRAKDNEFNVSAISLNIKSDGSITVSPYLPIVIGNVRRHSLSEYWQAKLYEAWSLDIVKSLANEVTCVLDMGYHKSRSINTWIDKDIELDIIEERLFT